MENEIYFGRAYWRNPITIRLFFIVMSSQPSTMVASISKKKKDFSLTDQIPLNKLFQSKFHFPFPLFSNKSILLYSYNQHIKNWEISGPYGSKILGPTNLGQLGLHGKANIEKTNSPGNPLSKHNIFLYVCCWYSVEKNCLEIGVNKYKMADNCLLGGIGFDQNIKWNV